MANLMSELTKQIKPLIVDNFDSHPFLATLMKYVLYYKEPTGRVKSCNDLKLEIYKSFFIIDDDTMIMDDPGALYGFFGDGATGLNFPDRRSDFAINQNHVANIKDALLSFKYYVHKWWEHTNIDFSCKLLKNLLVDFDYGISDSEKMLFIKSLSKASSERSKSANDNFRSRHYSTALRKDHFLDSLTDDPFNWEDFLGNFGNKNKIDGDEDEYWTIGWKRHKDFYGELANILKKVAELDDLQIKLNQSPHHFIECLKNDSTSTYLWENIQSSASLDTVQNFFPGDRTKTENIKQSLKKTFLSKHPEADFALRYDLQQLYKDYNYVTFATSLQDLDSEPDLQPGRPMLVIPGTKFVMPEIFKQELNQQSLSLTVQAHPRSKVTLQIIGRVVQGRPVNGCGSARIDLGWIPKNHRKRIFDRVREDVARAMTASGSQRRDIVDEIYGFILTNRRYVRKIPSKRDILAITSRCPQTVITFSN